MCALPDPSKSDASASTHIHRWLGKWGQNSIQVYVSGFDGLSYAGRVRGINEIGRAELWALVHMLLVKFKMLIRHIWAEKQRQIQVHRVTAHILDNRCVEEKER